MILVLIGVMKLVVVWQEVCEVLLWVVKGEDLVVEWQCQFKQLIFGKFCDCYGEDYVNCKKIGEVDKVCLKWLLLVIWWVCWVIVIIWVDVKEQYVKFGCEKGFYEVNWILVLLFKFFEYGCEVQLVFDDYFNFVCGIICFDEEMWECYVIFKELECLMIVLCVDEDVYIWVYFGVMFLIGFCWFELLILCWEDIDCEEMWLILCKIKLGCFQC